MMKSLLLGCVDTLLSLTVPLSPPNSILEMQLPANYQGGQPYKNALTLPVINMTTDTLLPLYSNYGN